MFLKDIEHRIIDLYHTKAVLAQQEAEKAKQEQTQQAQENGIDSRRILA